MATTIEYALLAGASYRDTRADINKFPIPDGWNMISRYPQDDATGFEAAAFTNGTKIVISYAGTYPGDFLGDQITNAALALGSGSASQLIQAAEYYLQVKASAPAGATITLTGHSLGGGLAALVGVFFGVETHTFDQAPFARTATLGAATLLGELTSKLDINGHRVYSDEMLAPLTHFIQLQQAPLAPSNFIPNAGLVTDINVQGEFLSEAPLTLFNRIGSTEYEFAHNPVDGILSGFDLHAQALLSAFQYSKDTAAAGLRLNEVTYKLTDLLKMIFDESLYAYSTASSNDKNVNLLEHLVRHQTGGVDGVSASGDAMLTRFTSDMWKLAQDGGLTLTDNYPANTDLNNVNNALIAFAMQKYYNEKTGSEGLGGTLFQDVSGGGGIQFDTAAVVGLGNSITNAKGYDQYFKYYLREGTVYQNGELFTQGIYTPLEQQLINTLLPYMRDWYVQAGANGMNATDTWNSGAFMLGGS